MKMKRLRTLMIPVLALALLAGCGGKHERLQQISAEEAKTYALLAAGLDLKDVQMQQPQKDTREGLEYYRVQFDGAAGSYRYDVDALTGVVIDSEIPQSQPSAGDENKLLSLEEAKNIALTHAGKQAGEVTFVQAELDRDDGRSCYDIEFLSGKVEYDYEIDVNTGAVLEVDKDAEHYTPPVSDGEEKTLLTREQVKAVALAHAGKTAGQVTFVQVELDKDDRRSYYDIEFYSDKVEYDYEIDAYTGAVLEYDQDAENYTPPVSGGSKLISAEQAKAVALGQVKGAGAEHIREFELDRDDGRLEYEGKILFGGMEYEFEIDGYSGAIRHWEVERADRDD